MQGQHNLSANGAATNAMVRARRRMAVVWDRAAFVRRQAWLATLCTALLLQPLVTDCSRADEPTNYERFFGSDNRDTSTAVAAFPDGGVISAGYTRASGNSSTDILLLRLDPAGNLLWQKSFGGPARDLATAVAPLPDGGFVTAAVTQNSEGEGEGEGDALISRHDANGSIVWEKRYGGARYDIPYGVAIDRKGSIVVVGYTKSSGAGDADGWLLALDNKGERLWERTYGGEGRDWLRAVVVLPNGDLAVAGGTKPGKDTATAAWVMRLDSKGEKRWEHIFNNGESVARSIVGLADGSIAIGGSALEKDSQTGRDVWIVRFDASGRQLYEKKLGGSGDDQTEAMVALPDGDIALVGGTTQNLAVVTVRTAWMMKFNDRGKLAWKRSFEGKSDQLFGLCVLPGERIAASGTSWQAGKGEDVWVLTLDKLGRYARPRELRQLQSSIQ